MSSCVYGHSMTTGQRERARTPAWSWHDNSRCRMKSIWSRLSRFAFLIVQPNLEMTLRGNAFPRHISCCSSSMIGLKSTLNVLSHSYVFCLASCVSFWLYLLHVQVIDNSGALLVECVNILKNKVNNGWGSVGDEIVCVVKKARPISAASQASVNAVKVRQGDVRRAVIVRTRKPVRRPDGRIIRFDDNAAVLLNNKREMLGTRIGGLVSADLRMKGWGKVVSLAPKVSVSLVIELACVWKTVRFFNYIICIVFDTFTSQSTRRTSLVYWTSKLLYLNRFLLHFSGAPSFKRWTWCFHDQHCSFRALSKDPEISSDIPPSLQTCVM